MKSFKSFFSESKGIFDDDYAPDKKKTLKIYGSDKQVHKAATSMFGKENGQHGKTFHHDPKKQVTTIGFSKHIDNTAHKKLQHFNSNWKTSSTYHD